MEGKDNNYDVVIIGAGISGIDAAYRLQTQCPDHTFTILEARDAIGGTWDLFKFPGIRSDSDLYTFGFPFRPWTEKTAIAEADAILNYLNDTVNEYGIDRKVQFRHKLEAADWSSDQQAWNLSVDASGERKQFHCNFLLVCTGYYDYHNPLPAIIPGIENFKGKVVHPQFWPADLDYTGKNVTIVGSGATAITLLPNVAKTAAMTTMLQRSPSYIAPMPQDDALNRLARRWLPIHWAYTLIRIKSFLLPYIFYLFCRAAPNAARWLLKKGASDLLPQGYPMDPNFKPAYNPWDQRLCITPKGDFFDAIKQGKADVVTDSIKTVTEDSIVLNNSDRVLKPDIIVTATGLRILLIGGARITVDKEPIIVSSKHLYKGIMLQDVPNAAVVIGYANASWTLGADATAQFTTRLLNHMKRRGYTSAVPKLDPSKPMKDAPVLNINSTYVASAKDIMPKAGSVGPWRPRTMWLRDLWDAQHGTLEDLHFSSVST